MKLFCNTKYGLPTQMFFVENFPEERRDILDNLLMQCRVKVGIKAMMVDSTCLDGLGFDRHKTMFFGIDVIHSSIDVGNCSKRCLIAGVVGSTDADFYHYASDAMIQQPISSKTSTNIASMFQKLLTVFKEKNNYFPQSVIVFQNGFRHQTETLKHAKNQLAEMISTIFKTTNIITFKITWVISLKQNYARFMLPNDPTQNIPVGTAVFESIVEAGNKTFYLNAHNVLKVIQF